MLFIAIPAYNEVETIGVLLWRLRTTLAEFPREYEVVVYDDCSTDSTNEVLENYKRTLPLTVIRGSRQVGYAASVDALLRHVVRQTRHPRRDAVLLMQADFTDPPELIPEFARRFEGGADIVVGERTTLADAPKAVQRLFRYASWSMRSLLKVNDTKDATSTFKLVRIAAIRDLLEKRGQSPLCEGDSWTANADLLLHLTPFVRRVEAVPVESTYGVRMRGTRRAAMRDTMTALKWAWSARTRRPGTLPPVDTTAAAPGIDRKRTRSRKRPDAAATADADQRDVERPRRKRNNNRRRKEGRPTAQHRATLPDATEETLSIVDPAAGIAAGLELGKAHRVSGSDESITPDSEVKHRKRRRRTRRARSDTDTAGQSGASRFSDASDNRVDSSPASDVGGSTPDDRASDSNASPVESHARRRGRRGRRGGRRTRRDHGQGATEDGGAAGGAESDG